MSQAFKFAFEDENNEDDVPKDDSESIVEDAPVSRLAPTLHELDDIVRLSHRFRTMYIGLLSLPCIVSISLPYLLSRGCPHS